MSKRFGSKKGRRVTTRRTMNNNMDRIHAVKGVQRSLRKMQKKQELKWRDLLFGDITAIPGGTYTCLNGLVRGTTSTTRVGDRISATSIQGRYHIHGDTVSPGLNYPQEIRVCIFMFRDADSIVPSDASLLDTTTITTPIHAPYNRDYQKDYKILYDKTLVVNAAAGVAAAPITMGYTKRFKIPLFGKEVIYSQAANTGTYTDIAANALYVVWWGSTITTPAIINLSTRFYFKDT